MSPDLVAEYERAHDDGIWATFLDIIGYDQRPPGDDARAPPVPVAQPQHTEQPRAQPAVPPVPACSHVIAERVSLPTAGATVPIAPWLPSALVARAPPSSLCGGPARAEAQLLLLLVFVAGRASGAVSECE